MYAEKEVRRPDEGPMMTPVRLRLAAIASPQVTQGLEIPDDRPLVCWLLRGYPRNRGTVQKKKLIEQLAAGRHVGRRLLREILYEVL